MRKANKIVFVLLLCFGYILSAWAQNLSSMPVAQRDSLLIAIAKKAVLIYGPNYYREYQEPAIEPLSTNPETINAGRVPYLVTFLYDSTQEVMAWGYAAKVTIRGDGTPSSVFFGNGFGRIIPETGLPKGWKRRRIKPILYEDFTFPFYDIHNPDPRQDPENMDVLIERGYVRIYGGPDKWDKWERRKPHTPPAYAQPAIKRALKEMKAKKK